FGLSCCEGIQLDEACPEDVMNALLTLSSELSFSPSCGERRRNLFSQSRIFTVISPLSRSMRRPPPVLLGGPVAGRDAADPRGPVRRVHHMRRRGCECVDVVDRPVDPSLFSMHLRGPQPEIQPL